MEETLATICYGIKVANDNIVTLSHKLDELAEAIAKFVEVTEDC